MLASPLLAVSGTVVLYSLLHFLREAGGITAETCFCVGSEVLETHSGLGPTATLARVEHLTLRVGTPVTCRSHYEGRLLGLQASTVLDRMHYLSAGAVSFARGLNDTPKIAALLLLAPRLSGFGSMALVGLAIGAGGWIGARRVAGVMSEKITPMNHGQGFTANLVTSLVVLSASGVGLARFDHARQLRLAVWHRRRVAQCAVENDSDHSGGVDHDAAGGRRAGRGMFLGMLGPLTPEGPTRFAPTSELLESSEHGMQGDSFVAGRFMKLVIHPAVEAERLSTNRRGGRADAGGQRRRRARPRAGDRRCRRLLRQDHARRCWPPARGCAGCNRPPPAWNTICFPS